MLVPGGQSAQWSKISAIGLVIALLMSACIGQGDDDGDTTQTAGAAATTTPTSPPPGSTSTPVIVPTSPPGATSTPGNAPANTPTPIPTTNSGSASITPTATATSTAEATVTPTATATLIPSTPVPTATSRPAPRPTATPRPPWPTATPRPITPTPTPSGPDNIWISCEISPKRTVAVGEALTFRALQKPTGPYVSYSFNHGDGTIDNRAVSNAYYRAPGTYRVTMRWQYGYKTGSVFCGNVTVVGAYPTPTPTAIPGYLNVGCSISPQRPVMVGEILTFTAFHSPQYVPVSYVFNHGDGTLDPGRVSTAYYQAPGTYNVTLNWSTSNRQGTVFCGSVLVSGVVITPTPTPIPTQPQGTPVPTSTPSPGLTVSCSVVPSGPIVVGQVVTITAWHSPANIPVQYVISHGDGTLDSGPVSYAYYQAPGTYSPTARWAALGTNGTVSCGTVTVTN